MKTVLHQRRIKTTVPLVAISTTAAAAIAFFSISASSPRITRHCFSTMSSKDPESSKPIQSKEWPTRKYTSRHTSFPYTTGDLTPRDTRPDAEFYATPRFVAHIDDHAISVLKQYYGQVLPHGAAISGDAPTNPTPNILDLCSSWISHYPPSLEAASASGAVSIAGIGMNAAELAANPLFRRPRPRDPADDAAGTATTASSAPSGNTDTRMRFLVRDLNTNPSIPPFTAIHPGSPAEADAGAGATTRSDSADGDNDEDATPTIDATTLTVSIDYLTSPVALLTSLRARTKPGGTLHVAVSNRCFPTKAVRAWVDVGVTSSDRLEMVGEMLLWSGWGDVEIVELCDGTVGEGEGGEGAGAGGGQGMLERLLEGMGMGGGGRVDPLWVVRGRNIGVGDGQGV